MITPQDLRDFAEKTGLDLSNYTDEEIQNIIEYTISSIEKFTGCPIVSREVVEVKPRVKSTIITNYPIGSVSKVEVKFHGCTDYTPIEGYDVLGDIGVYIGCAVQGPVTARITYTSQEADPKLVDRILLRACLSELVQKGKWEYLYAEHPKTIKEGDVQITYPTVSEQIEDMQATIDYDLSLLKRRLLFMI